jgi:hypothetical protein
VGAYLDLEHREEKTMADFDAHHPLWFFESDRRAEAVEALRAYFDPVSGLTGAWFEQLADQDHPNNVTAKDLVAVTTLAVDIPARKSIWILGEGAGQVSELLAQIPAGQAIWDDNADLEPDGPAWTLWKLIESRESACPTGYGGMGVTKISKLLAAKRPNLVPIQDSHVDLALFSRPIDNYWEPWQRLYRSEKGTELRETAHSVREEAGVGELLGALRIIDIVIWTWAKKNLRSRTHDND